MEFIFKVRTTVLIVLILFLGQKSFADTGKISGLVSDQKTGETLIGVTIKIKGFPKAVASGVDGRFSINNLLAGKYTVQVSYVGYTIKEVSDVEVLSGKATNLNVLLSESSVQNLQEVVVRATFKQESTNALYAQQKNSALISDGISSDQIKKSPDRNTSDILKRVSGATIQDNKFVVVRGLSDRYNTATLDNSTLPSTEPNRRAFSFDIVPSNLVDKITISKTATPDLPADFAGGAVQITTKDIPDENFTSFGIGYGYNSQSTFKNFLGTNKIVQNYLGFDNGSSNLAINFPSKESIAAGTLSDSKNKAALKSLPSDFKINNQTALPNQNYQFNIGRVKQFKDDSRFGALVSLTYRNAQNISSDLIKDFYVYDYKDNVYKFSTNLGALANFAYSYGGNKISFKNIYNRAYDNVYTERTGINSGATTMNKFYAYDLMQKTLFKSTLEGDHQIGTGKSKLKWTASVSNITNDQPNQLKINYAKSLGDINNLSVPYQANITSLGKENTRLFSKLDEQIYAADVNFNTPLKILKTSSQLKVGLGSQYRQRSFQARFLGMELNSKDITEQTLIRSLPITEIFSQDLINSGVYQLREIGSTSDNYKANSLTNYGYAMLDQKFGEKNRIVYGLRVEQYNVQLTANTKLVDDQIIDLLPSINYTYSLTSKSNLRASYYRTLARPEFRELAPFSYYDYELLANQSGNSNLKRTSINNVDFRYELYPSTGEIFSFSVFYKNFSNAIETYRYDVNSTPDISFFNTAQAKSYGIELEARKNLSFINTSNAFKNTTAYINLAFIKSEVKNPNDQNYIDKVRPMVGQSPYVINAGLQHSALQNKLNFNLLYNRVGRRIIQASGINFASTWENPRNVVDFQVGYKIMKSKGEIKLNGGDLLNERYLIYFDNNANKKYDPAQGDETQSSFKLGRNISVSFNYNF